MSRDRISYLFANNETNNFRKILEKHFRDFCGTLSYDDYRSDDSVCSEPIFLNNKYYYMDCEFMIRFHVTPRKMFEDAIHHGVACVYDLKHMTWVMIDVDY